MFTIRSVIVVTIEVALVNSLLLFKQTLPLIAVAIGPFAAFIVPPRPLTLGKLTLGAIATWTVCFVETLALPMLGMFIGAIAAALLGENQFERLPFESLAIIGLNGAAITATVIGGMMARRVYAAAWAKC